jgi:hypothetical protein
MRIGGDLRSDNGQSYRSSNPPSRATLTSINSRGGVDPERVVGELAEAIPGEFRQLFRSKRSLSKLCGDGFLLWREHNNS